MVMLCPRCEGVVDGRRASEENALKPGELATFVTSQEALRGVTH
jgi:hypothetical protein